jgi:hypothetical protein
MFEYKYSVRIICYDSLCGGAYEIHDNYWWLWSAKFAKSIYSLNTTTMFVEIIPIASTK